MVSNDTVRTDLISDHEMELYNEWVNRNQDEFTTMGNKMTVCKLTLKSGFEVIGTSGCEDVSKFDAVMGRTYAMKDALRKMDEFAAFYRAEDAHRMQTPDIEARVSPFVTASQVEALIREALREHTKYRH